MTIGVNNYYYNPRHFGTITGFRARQTNGDSAPIMAAPINKVENILGSAADTFVPEKQRTDEHKKSYKNAIRAGSAFLVIGGLVALLNPNFLGKWAEKMRVAAARAGNEAKNKNNLWGKTLRFGEKFFSKVATFLNYSNNFNSVKDKFFKWMCTEKKEFKKVKWDPLRSVLKTVDGAFVKVMKGTHGWITKSFDKISRSTVLGKYSSANTSIKSLNESLMKYRSRLNPTEQAAFDAKLSEIKNIQDFFSESKVLDRLKEQEKIMGDFEQKTTDKMKEYGGNIWNCVSHFKFGKSDKEYFRQNMRFWAEDILAPTKEKVSADGKRVVDSLIGDGKAQKGAYNEIIEILSPHLKPEERTIFKELHESVSKKLRTANKSECIKYFDKKRDFILGSAPTDVLTAFIGLVGSGFAIGMADNKDERVSRTVSGAIPVIAGLGVSMGMTAMLISGVKGLLAGLASSILLSKAGSYVDKHFIASANNKTKNPQNSDKKEVKIA